MGRGSGVGYAVLRTRLGADSGAVATWFPASTCTGTRLRLRDYLDEQDAPSSHADTLAAGLVNAGAPADEVRQWLDTPTLACRQPPRPRPGRLPLVLLAPGNDEGPADLARLAESLAARGFVVAGVEFPTRHGAAPLASEGDVGRMAEVQADELRAAARAVGARMPVDTMTVAVVGHSFGARGGLLLAMRWPAVRALVSLDGGIGSATGVDAMRAAPSFAVGGSHATILHLFERLDPRMRPDGALLRSLGQPTWVAEVGAMRHHHFTILGEVPPTLPGLRRALGYLPHTDADVAEVRTVVGRFLDAMLRSGTFGQASGTARVSVRRPGAQGW